jgi:redox-sensitive bicupin YhaK (pirin superfamily)
MSGTLPANEPACIPGESAAIELVLAARARDVDGFSVRRVLPASSRRLVGPFIFFDHMGPARLPTGRGLDVRPHPHIALATVTYLFEGEILHRDNLGSVQPIRPGDINWMLAGRGVVHSERSSEEQRRQGPQVHGLQCWVALPLAHEEDAPRFEHHPAAAIPVVDQPGARLEVLAGTAYGARSPVGVVSPTLYVHGRLRAGARLPVDGDHEERAFYVVEGEVACDGHPFGAGTMVVLRPGAPVTLEAAGPARLVLVGGARLDGERHVWWNFVSSTRAGIERAKQDWRGGPQPGRFAPIPNDDAEFIPLPDR